MTRGTHRRRSLARGVGTVTLLTVILGVGAAAWSSNELGIPPDRWFAGTPERLVPLPAPPAETGSYAFLQTQPGKPDEPVTYDPCRRVRIVVNPQGAPAGTDGLIREAARTVGRASGLLLDVVGQTDERPRADRPLSDPRRYGDGPSPVLVAWSDPSEIPGLRGDVAGLGGSTAISTGLGGRLTYVTGAVTLDAPAMERILARPGERSAHLAEVRAIVLHELAHLVGLDHVDDPDELMSHVNRGLLRFGAGDLRGLTEVGDGPCRR